MNKGGVPAVEKLTIYGRMSPSLSLSLSLIHTYTHHTHTHTHFLKAHERNTKTMVRTQNSGRERSRGWDHRSLHLGGELKLHLEKSIGQYVFQPTTGCQHFAFRTPGLIMPSEGCYQLETELIMLLICLL